MNFIRGRVVVSLFIHCVLSFLHLHVEVMCVCVCARWCTPAAATALLAYASYGDAEGYPTVVEVGSLMVVS
jgi:hypothetical protein